MKRSRTALAVLAALVFLLARPPHVANAYDEEGLGLAAQGLGVAMPPPLDVLVNAGFEDGFTVRGGASEVEVAVGWEADFLQGDHPMCRAPCHRPEYKPEQQAQFVTEGRYSQRWFSTYSRHFGVLYQRILVQRRAWYEFSCDMKLKSNPPGGPAMFVGIQPWGSGTFGRQMIWGEETGEQDTWVRMRVVAQAWGDWITVAVASNPAWPTKEAQTQYVDNCSLTRVARPGQDCQDCPEPDDCPDVCDCEEECPCGEAGACDYQEFRAIMEDLLAESLVRNRPVLVWPEP